MKPFEISTSSGDVRMELSSGTIMVWDAEGEERIDGWATLEDIAEFLVDKVSLPPDEALFVAGEAVEMWREWLDSN